MALGVVFQCHFFVSRDGKMKTVKNVTDKRLRLVSANGAMATYIEAGQTRQIHESLFVPACAQGCVPSGKDSDVDNLATPADESKVPALVVAMNEILDEGDESKLTNSGCPKANHIKAIAGEHTADERELAWEEVKVTRALEDMD